MANFSFQLGNGGPDSKAGSFASRIVMFLFGTPFAAGGLFAVWDGIKKLHDTVSMEGIFIALFGLVFAAFGLGLMYAAVTAERRRKAAGEKWRAQTDGGSKPWLARADWAAGKIKSSAGAQTKILAVFALVFCGIGGFSAFFGLPEELHKGNFLALLVLLFPAVGIGFLFAVMRGILARRRFGDCHFEMVSIPGALGGTLEGLIQTGARLRLEHGLHLKLSCIRVTVSGSGGNQSRQENILWQDEKVFKSKAGLPEPRPGRSGIPVYFKLPAGQPECGDGIFWRLEAKAKLSGPDFSAVFDVPVFKVAGAAVVEADKPDPTAALQMPVEQLRRDENSRIQVTNGPHGREFYFPAARNVIGAVMTMVFCLVFCGGMYLVLCVAPDSESGMLTGAAGRIFGAVVLGLFIVILGWSSFNLWFKSSRVTINSSRVTLLNRWLFFSRTRQFDVHEISRFDLKAGMTSGSQVFQDIKLVTRASEDSFAARKARYERTGERPQMKFRISDPSGITLASAIGNTSEAKWLVQEMTKALGRTV